MRRPGVTALGGLSFLIVLLQLQCFAAAVSPTSTEAQPEPQSKEDGAFALRGTSASSSSETNSENKSDKDSNRINEIVTILEAQKDAERGLKFSETNMMDMGLYEMTEKQLMDSTAPAGGSTGPSRSLDSIFEDLKRWVDKTVEDDSGTADPEAVKVMLEQVVAGPLRAALLSRFFTRFLAPLQALMPELGNMTQPNAAQTASHLPVALNANPWGAGLFAPLHPFNLMANAGAVQPTPAQSTSALSNTAQSNTAGSNTIQTTTDQLSSPQSMIDRNAIDQSTFYQAATDSKDDTSISSNSSGNVLGRVGTNGVIGGSPLTCPPCHCEVTLPPTALSPGMLSANAGYNAASTAPISAAPWGLLNGPLAQTPIGQYWQAVIRRNQMWSPLRWLRQGILGGSESMSVNPEEIPMPLLQAANIVAEAAEHAFEEAVPQLVDTVPLLKVLVQLAELSPSLEN